MTPTPKLAHTIAWVAAPCGSVHPTANDGIHGKASLTPAPKLAAPCGSVGPTILNSLNKLFKILGCITIQLKNPKRPAVSSYCPCSDRDGSAEQACTKRLCHGVHTEPFGKTRHRIETSFQVHLSSDESP